MPDLFLHVPKCGGTTLANIFRRQHPDGAIYEIYEPGQREARRQLGRLSPSEKKGIQVVMGHFSFGIHREFRRDSRYVTVLRNPLERVISAYHHAATNKGHPLHQTIADRGMSLEDVLSEETMPELDNCQARMLSGFDFDVPYGSCGDVMLERAIQNLEEYFIVVGHLERFDETLLLLRDRLDWSRHVAYRRSNVSSNRPRKDDLSEETVALIRRFTRLDQELVDYARRRLDREIEEAGLSFGFRRLVYRAKKYSYRPVASLRKRWAR